MLHACFYPVGAIVAIVIGFIVSKVFGAPFDRVPLLWPLLMGALLGFGVSWRLALADKVSLITYALPGMLGGALALATPYLAYVLFHRLFSGERRSDIR